MLSEERLERNSDENPEEKTHQMNEIQKRDLRNKSKIKKPSRYEANMVETTEPITFQEALSKDAVYWTRAIEEELSAYNKNKSWRLTSLPKDSSTCKWVFKMKKTSSEGKPRYKTRLCVKEFTQKPDIDYEIFSPVVRYKSIRTFLALTAKRDLEIKQFDVKTAFLRSDLNEEIYMDIPEGVNADKDQVCRLERSLYGLKEVSQWNFKFDSFLKTLNLIQSNTDSYVYKGCFKMLLFFFICGRRFVTCRIEGGTR